MKDARRLPLFRPLEISLIFFSIIIFLFGLLLQHKDILFLAVILSFSGNIMFLLSDLKKHIVYGMFLVAFFTFLLGGVVCEYLFGYQSNYKFSDTVLCHTYISLYIALLALDLGYHFFLKIIKNDQVNISKNKTDPKRFIIQKISKIMFFITYIPWITATIETVIYVQQRGYISYYTDYHSSLPYVFIQIANMSAICFYIFIATFPEFKSYRVPQYLYLFQAILGLFTGKRTNIIIPIMIIIIYRMLREREERTGQWFHKKMIYMLIIITPLILSFMYTYRYSRVDAEQENSSFTQTITGFFEDTGFSVNVISFEKIYEDNLPEKNYSFGSVIDYARENVVTQIFFDFPAYSGQTYESAVYRHNFAHTITYVDSPSYYLSGHGYGSSYIAEAYHDFGYLGIILFSLIYSCFFAFFSKTQNMGILFTTLSFIALRAILIAPRGAASQFLADLINVHSWLVIILIFGFAKLFYQNRKRSSTI